MNIYKLTFNDGTRFQSTTETLSQTQSKVVSYINKNNLINCVITCLNGQQGSVAKTGQWHPIHNGFLFN
jgi:hypothetical protein